MEESIESHREYREYRSSERAVDGFLDEKLYEDEMQRRKLSENSEERRKRTQTKKQKDYQSVKAALLRIIVSGVLFLLIYLLAEFEPSFVPFTIQDVKEAIRENIFSFIR